MVTIPKLTSIQNALVVYHTYHEISNAEIEVLFGRKSDTTVSKLKKLVYKEMDKQKIKSCVRGRINTKIAFDVWGFDIDDLEYRHMKLQDLGLTG